MGCVNEIEVSAVRNVKVQAVSVDHYSCLNS
jgi:hypothetical protein